VKKGRIRERIEDVPMHVNYFTQKYYTPMSRNIISIHPAALKRPEMCDYPRNVRELENMIERTIVVGNEDEIHSAKALKVGIEP
jgi:transcriptional regulator with GAF, ATPase, and Fis domain